MPCCRIATVHKEFHEILEPALIFKDRKESRGHFKLPTTPNQNGRTTNAQRRQFDLSVVLNTKPIICPAFFSLPQNTYLETTWYIWSNMDYQHTQTGHSLVETRHIMSLSYIANPDPAYRLAYQGHSPFFHGGMGMSLLNSALEVPPVANEEGLDRLCFHDNGQESAFSAYTITSPSSARDRIHWIQSPTISPLSLLPPLPAVPVTPKALVSTPFSSWPSERTSESIQTDKSIGDRGSVAAVQPSIPFMGWLDSFISEALAKPVLAAESVPSGTSVDCGRGSSSAYVSVFSEGYGRYAQITEPAASLRSTYITEKQSSGSRTNSNILRYEDGEVLRYGAGESYRPFNNASRDRERSPPPPAAARRPRSPMRARSPVRDRERDLRGRSPPPVAPDSYVPNRSPRRRSRSPDRYRGPDRARDIGGESWRRRDVSRTRARSPLRRTPPRRRSPGRFSPGPRRDDRLFDRARSPRRDFDVRDR